MGWTRRSFVVAAVLALGACVTTQQAEKAVSDRYAGQPSDAFFARYGAPYSSFPLNDGGTVYRWRGGQTTVAPLPQSQPIAAPVAGAGTSSSHTSTTTSHPSPGTTVTNSSTTTFSAGVVAPQQLLVPAPPVQVFCEADITVDATGRIRSIHTTQDTRGVGLSMSRCAELFDVK